MDRQVKTFAQPVRPTAVGPTSNKFTLDLGGLTLSEEHLGQVRSEAVKAAMLAAAELLRDRSAFDGFGTFSTFSTFSTFGMSSGRHGLPFELADDISPGAKQAIEETFLQGGE